MFRLKIRKIFLCRSGIFYPGMPWNFTLQNFPVMTMHSPVCSDLVMPVEPALNPEPADLQMFSLTSDNMNLGNICPVRPSDIESLGKKMKGLSLEYINIYVIKFYLVLRTYHSAMVSTNSCVKEEAITFRRFFLTY